MARTNNLTNFLTDVAGAIKEKKGSEANIPAANFDTEIRNLPSQGTYQEKSVTIYANGTQTIEPDTGYDAISELEVTTQVPDKQLQTKNYNFTTNGNVTLEPDTGYDGFSSIGLNIAVPSGSGDVKLFDTVKHMQADPDAEEGDLAVVYREELTGIDENSEFSSCTFPNTVVLSSAYTGSAYCSFRATDGGWFDGMVDVSSSSFRFNGYGESAEIRIEYTSSDGITYTRTDGGEELVDFGTTIKFENYGEPFPEVVGNFMKIGGNYFEGLYEYKTFVDTDNAFIPRLSDWNINDLSCDLTDAYGSYNLTKVFVLIDNIKANVSGASSITDWSLLYINNQLAVGYIHATVRNSEIIGGVNLYSANGTSVTNAHSGSYNNNYTIENVYLRYFALDLTNMTYSAYVDLQPEGNYIVSSNNVKRFYWSSVAVKGVGPVYNSTTKVQSTINLFNSTDGYVWKSNSNVNVYKTVSKYILTDTQLDATSDFVYQKTFYGKNGVETGTLTDSINSTFDDTSAEIYSTIQAYYNSLTPRVLTNQDKTINSNITIIPCKSDGTPLIDTHSVTDMSYMFSNHASLVAIPILDTSNVTTMQNAFSGCSKLTHIPSLDTSNVTTFKSAFAECTNLKSVALSNTGNAVYMNFMFNSCPSLLSISQLDTHSVQYMNRMFYGCTSLTTVPQLNASSVLQFNLMFSDCTSLSNTSLNNILAMCVSATSYTGTKTLYYLFGETDMSQYYPASTIQGLSNYSAFTSAGWSIGW